MIKKNLKIGLDFDGVMADTTKLKQKIAQEIYGVCIPSHRFKEYMVVADGYLNHQQYRNLMNMICGDRNIGLNMEAVQESIKYLQILKKDHQLVVITSREDKELEVAKEWCVNRDLKLNFISVGYNKDKIEAARGLDIYVDDDLPKLSPLIGIVPRLFLFSQDHNLGHEVPNEILRISSWKNFIKNLLD